MKVFYRLRFMLPPFCHVVSVVSLFALRYLSHGQSLRTKSDWIWWKDFMNPSSFQLKFQRSSFFSSRVGTTDVLNLKAVFSGKKQILKWANIELNSFDSFVAPGQRPWTFRTSHPKNPNNTGGTRRSWKSWKSSVLKFSSSPCGHVLPRGVGPEHWGIDGFRKIHRRESQMGLVLYFLWLTADNLSHVPTY